MIGFDETLPLPMEGTLPPDLQGTLVRIGPRAPEGTDGDGTGEGTLHALELRDGQAVWYRSHESAGDAGVFWHSGSLLALPESGFPSQFSRFLEPEEFNGGLTVPDRVPRPSPGRRRWSRPVLRRRRHAGRGGGRRHGWRAGD